MLLEARVQCRSIVNNSHALINFATAFSHLPVHAGGFLSHFHRMFAFFIRALGILNIVGKKKNIAGCMLWKVQNAKTMKKKKSRNI